MALDPVQAARLADRQWARGILRSRPRLDRLYQAMKDGDPVAYESLDYLTRMHQRGTPAVDVDGKTMVTSDDGYLKDAEQTHRVRMATGPDGRLSVASK